VCKGGKVGVWDLRVCMFTIVVSVVILEAMQVCVIVGGGGGG